jgi:hypothetical protein
MWPSRKKLAITGDDAMRINRRPTVKALLLLTALCAAHAGVLAGAPHFSASGYNAWPIIAWQAAILAFWTCFGASVIVMERDRWRAFADCFGLRFAACVLSYLVYLGPPGLPYWRPPGTDLIARPPPVPLWAANSAFHLMYIDSSLADVLDRLVGRKDPYVPTIQFTWPYAIVSFVLTSALYGLFMYALALTCKERERPSTGADAG